MWLGSPQSLVEIRFCGLEDLGRKGLRLKAFFILFAFSPFRPKNFSIGPHMALSRYQKEGRCVR